MASRRRQMERSAETRAKVVLAATECVAELGFRGATMSAIAARAGVTWGAIQHQFHEKDAIFDAVLESSLAELERQLAGLAQGDRVVAARVREFVAAGRVLVRGPRYRAFVEIQLNRSRDERRDAAAERAWGQHVLEVIERAWASAFGDLGLPAARMRAGRRHAFMVLSGIAAESMLFPEVDLTRQHLAVLDTSLRHILDGD